MLKNFTSIPQAERIAKKSTRIGTFNWLNSGAENGFTSNVNIDDLKNIRLIPKILTKNNKLNLETNFFKIKMRNPLVLCPMGHQTQFYSKGEAATAAALNKGGHLGFFSTQGRTSFDTLSNQNPDVNLVYQIFPFGDKDWIMKEIKKAEINKSKALSFCFDAPVRSHRHLDRESNYDARKFGKGKPISQNPSYALNYDWEFIKWVKSKTKLKIIPKGLISIDDIKSSIKYGSDAIWISNHGGRMFNSGISCSRVLINLKKKIKIKVPIIVDGGVRQGTDIIKYICLGANFVGIGRPAIFGLIIDGQRGVERIFSILTQELKTAMLNGGFKTIKEMNYKRLDLSEKF
jgi:isopentenyl diphosphate isomerase/L-lactate dehydrogenase-like FMN-dependent dehydrogenase